MKKIMLFALCLLALAACRKEKKDHDEEPVKLPLELLTAGKWILLGYGFDDNNNQRIDAGEDVIQPCQRDNTYEYNRDSTGFIRDNAISCNTGRPVSDFRWQFDQGFSRLIVGEQRINILKLTRDSMVLRHLLPGLEDSFRLITMYHR